MPVQPTGPAPELSPSAMPGDNPRKKSARSLISVNRGEQNAAHLSLATGTSPPARSWISDFAGDVDPLAVARLEEWAMTILRWALLFFLISIVAGVLGFTGISAASADIARFLFYVFVVIFLVLLILGLTIFRV